MLKKFFYAGALALALVTVMPSCGGGDKKGDTAETTKTERTPLEAKEVTVTGSTESDGTLAEYISLKDGSYTVNFTDANWGDDDYKAEVIVNVTAKQMPGYTDDMYIQGSDYKLVFLDENGSPLAGELTASSSEIDKLLKSGGDSAITFSAGNYLASDVVDNLVAKAKSVKIAASGNLTEMGSSSSSTDSEGEGVTEGDDDSESSDVSSSSSSSSSEVDELLDEYEKYINNAVSMYKKAKSGDPTVLMEYMSVYQDAVSLSEKLSNMKSEMTSAQVARLNKMLSKQASSLSAL